MVLNTFLIILALYKSFGVSSEHFTGLLPYVTDRCNHVVLKFLYLSKG